jgi:AcrR family transcriptional regulator
MPKSEKSAKKRNEIVDKAIAMQNQLDMKEATVRSICAAAGISVGTFYHYFPEKNSLITSILGRIDIYLTEEVAQQLCSKDEIENLINFALGFAHYTDRIGSASGGVISNSSFPLPITPEGLAAERQRPLYAIPKEILQRGQKNGQILADLNLDETVDLLIISLRGHSLEWSRRNRMYRIEDKIEKFMQLFTRSLRS